MNNMAKPKIQATDETDISEITISPDGRVFVFGASKPLLDLFAEIGWRDDGVQQAHLLSADESYEDVRTATVRERPASATP